MRTNTQEAVLSAYIVSIGKRCHAKLLRTPQNFADLRTRSVT